MPKICLDESSKKIMPVWCFHCTYISKIYVRFSTSRSNNNYTQIDKKHQSGKKANCFHFILHARDVDCGCYTILLITPQEDKLQEGDLACYARIKLKNSGWT